MTDRTERDYSGTHALRKAGRARRPTSRSSDGTTKSLLPLLTSGWQRPRHSTCARSTIIIFVRIDAPRDLARLARAVAHLKRDGALWIFHPKGRGASPTDGEVRSSGIAAGLVDNKISAYSESHTATRFVIPLALR